MLISHARATQSPFASNSVMLSRAALTPKLSIRPASTVLGWTAAHSAGWCVQRDTAGLAAAEAAYAEACRELGRANAARHMRRQRKATAFRLINTRRAQLRAARKALVGSQVTAAALAQIGH
jgi:hypothetical protein